MFLTDEKGGVCARRCVLGSRVELRWNDYGRKVNAKNDKLNSVCAGWVLIDRSGKHFGTVLNFLRDGSVSLPDTRKECMELLAEGR